MPPPTTNALQSMLGMLSAAMTSIENNPQKQGLPYAGQQRDGDAARQPHCSDGNRAAGPVKQFSPAGNP